MSSRSERERYVLVVIGVVAVASLLYSVLVARAVLAWFGILFPLVLLYLAWRFVLAHERIAVALETTDGPEPRDAPESTDE